MEICPQSHTEKRGQVYFARISLSGLYGLGKIQVFLHFTLELKIRVGKTNLQNDLFSEMP